MTEGNVAGSARSRRQKKKITWLVETTLKARVSAAGTTPLELSAHGVGARGLLTEATCAALQDRLATEHEHPLKPKEMPPTSCRRCRTAVELSIAGTECARLARVKISARVMSDSKAPTRSRIVAVRRRKGAASPTLGLVRVI